MKIPDRYKKNAPPNGKKKTAADYGWPDNWKPLTRETYDVIRRSRTKSYMPTLETLVAFGFRETTWWKGAKARTLFAYPIGAHLKIAFADIRETDKTHPGRFWWTTNGFPQDRLTGLELANPLDFMQEDVLITEGQWDAMTGAELGYAAFGLLNSSQNTLSDAVCNLLEASTVFLIGDNDGLKCSSRVIQDVKKHLDGKQITAHVIHLPGKVKDLCEMVKKYGPEQTRAYLDWCIAHVKARREITHFTNGAQEVVGTASAMVLTDPETGESTYVIEDICAADMTPRRKKWLWPNRIPLGQTLFSGLPDMGKSTVARDIAARVTRGEKFPDGENKYGPRKVIVLSSEEDKEDTYIPSLMAHGADLKQVHFATRTVVNKDGKRDERKIAFDRDLAAVEALIRKHDALLVIIDAFTSYLGNLRRNDDKEMRWLLEELNALAKRTGVAIISIGHFNKDGNKSGIHRISGAGALAEVPRAAWAFHFPPPEEEGETPAGKPIYKPRHHFMLNAKGNNVKDALKGGFQFDIDSVTLTIEGEPEELGRVKWGELTQETLESMLQRAKQQPGPKPQKLTAAKSWLENLLATGPMLAAEVTLAAEKADVNEFTLRDARQLLKVESYRNKGPHPQPYWWKLPDTLAPEGASVETNI